MLSSESLLVVSGLCCVCALSESHVILYGNRKKDDRLDWMYQGAAGHVSRDEYLLGRPIDKNITDQYEEPESGPSAETGLLPGSIFNPVTPASTMDLAAKIREDPLFQIRLVVPFSNLYGKCV